ncbi:MAG: hypothetical protein JWO38_4564 [Gemmataceae bacterium]|nr:hypothetical protein [Gemmataceae bacterium]
MGIHDRDYYRESTGGMFDTWARQGVTVWLIVITCAVFVAQVVTVTRDGPGPRSFAGSAVGEFGMYDAVRILGGEVWRLVTPIFLHAGLWHLAFNMFVLYWAGSRVEELYGGREFLLFYLAGGLIANAFNLLLYTAGLVHPVPALGASGAVTAVLVLYACHDPYHQVLMFLVVPVPLWFLAVFYVGLDTLGALGFGDRGTGYVVHLGGAMFGFLYYRSGWRLSALIPGLPSTTRRRAVPNLRVVSPDPHEVDDDRAEPISAAIEAPARAGGVADEQFEAKVDRVLEKVSRHGQESLTAEERELLFRASELYKKRRK